MSVSDLSQDVRHQSSSPTRGRELWPIIWTVGGICWLAITVIALTWSLPAGGTLTTKGDYYVSFGARLLHFALLFLLSAGAYRIALGQGWPVNHLSRARVIATHILLAALIVRIAPLVLSIPATYLDRSWPELIGGLNSWRPFHPTWMQWAGLLRFWLPPYVLGLVVVAAVLTAQRDQRESLRQARLSAEGASLGIFLFSAHLRSTADALHAISASINESPEQTVTMIARLGDFLRIALNSTKRPWTRVVDDVMGLQAYVALEQTRSRYRLCVQSNVDPAAMNCLVPTWLLQPMVESAIELGRIGVPDALLIKVSVRRTGERLIVEVSNSAPQLLERFAPSSFGERLGNVEARLKAAFREDASVTVVADPTCGTRATLEMPAVETRAD